MLTKPIDSRFIVFFPFVLIVVGNNRDFASKTKHLVHYERDGLFYADNYKQDNLAPNRFHLAQSFIFF